MTFGQVRAKNIMKIMSVLQNADSLKQAGEFGFLHLHPLHGNRAGTFGITIIGNWRLVISGYDDDGN